MTDLDVLLAAVLQDPADDTPRLVWADAIQDRDGPGDAARAELVRVQIEWSQLARKQDEFAMADISHFDRDRAIVTERQKGLRRRELQLLSPATWSVPAPGFGWTTRGLPNSDGRQGVVQWSRGFIAEVRGPLSALVGGECGCENGSVDTGGSTPWGEPINERCPHCHGTGRTTGILRELVRREPVEVVEVVDVKAWQGSGRWSLYNAEREDASGYHPQSDLPRDLFEQLSGGMWKDISGIYFSSEEFARAALSRALLAEAKGPVPACPRDRIRTARL